jgi:hypothetical protein
VIIKVILIVVVLSLFVSSLRIKKEVNSNALKKIGFVFLMISGVVAIISPELVTKLANLLGVGRGTDLMFYVFAVVFMYQLLNSYRSNKRNSAKITKLAREIALVDAERRYKQ